MTEPQPIGIGTLNDWVYRGADQANLRSAESPETLSDPSLAETRRAQQASLAGGLDALVSNGAQQLLSLSPTTAGFVAGAASPILMALELGAKQLEAAEQGEALRRARVRDSMYLALVNLVSHALPQAFVERTAHELRESQQGAEFILARLVSSPEFETNRAALEQHARQGVEAARARGIVDTESLAVARRDPAFDTRFRSNEAFRLGVRAELVAPRSAGGR